MKTTHTQMQDLRERVRATCAVWAEENGVTADYALRAVFDRRAPKIEEHRAVVMALRDAGKTAASIAEVLEAMGTKCTRQGVAKALKRWGSRV